MDETFIGGIERGPFFVLSVPLVDRRLGHRQQFPHQGIELLKFFRRTAHIASVIAPLAVLIAVLSAQSQPPAPRGRKGESNPPNKQTQPSQAQVKDIRGTQESPVVVSVLPIPQTQEEAARMQAERDEKAAGDRWIKRLTGFTALIGFLQALMLFRQTRISQKQNRVMEVQNTIMETQSAVMKSQLTAATLAAQASKESADALRLTQRAQLGVPHDGWTSHYDPREDPAHQLKITFGFKNAGPSLGFFSHVVFFERRSTNDSTPPAMEFSPKDGDWDNPAVILPGQTIPQNHYPLFASVMVNAQNEIDDLMSGKTSYWILGRISYRDIFGNSHFTNFSARFHFPTRTFTFPLVKGYADGN